ncbi:ParB/RepB/Spo0J family partition protein [Achromobacter mucicolens]|uniref:ParB/RepB/Spo0J family partition protein n=1 Tax=Achromobacter mucicolens TaxID=1389922 RepID=UPI003209DE5A
MWLVDGHRRHKQIGQAIAAGAPLQDEDGVAWIDITAFVGNDADRTARVISNAQGRHLNPAGNRLRLRQAGGFKWDTERIGRLKIGVAPVGRQDDRAATGDVHALVRSGAVEASTAIEAVAKHGEGAGAFLQGEFEKAKASGKSRVKPSTIHGRALPARSSPPSSAGSTPS